MDALTDLDKQAEKAGFTVGRTRKGHRKLTAPDGQVIIGSGTPSDYRGALNHRARLEAHGLSDAQQEPERVAKAQEKTENVNTSLLVLDFLQQKPGQTFSPKEIADALGLVPVRVSAALQYLNRQHPEVMNERRGAWSWRPDHPHGRDRRQTTMGGLLEQTVPVGLPEGMASTFVPVTTHRSGATVLRDGNGDLWLAQPIAIEMWPVLGALGFNDPRRAATPKELTGYGREPSL